ncbi:hypothetical protein HJG60_011528 [Phyllostomus discolor]|uniref:Uncharacterized protein n=1 Tax=Phyllostomus discolor TaxID=89673 RepID=A0A833ZZ58_9CHIR|nr:hypothetical protein HJG60_011528 [Phyllostomus discolor]
MVRLVSDPHSVPGLSSDLPDHPLPLEHLLGVLVSDLYDPPSQPTPDFSPSLPSGYALGGQDQGLAGKRATTQSIVTRGANSRGHAHQKGQSVQMQDPLLPSSAFLTSSLHFVPQMPSIRALWVYRTHLENSASPGGVKELLSICS